MPASRRQACSPSSRKGPPPIQTLVGNSERIRKRVSVEEIPVRYLCQGREGVGRLLNVSRAGVLIRASEIPAAGALAALHFRSPTGRIVEVRGEVVWNVEDLFDSGEASGFGVRLCEPPPEYREFLRWAEEQADQAKRDESETL